MNDERLIAECLQNDATAWAALRTRIHRLAGVWANRLHIAPDMIEDITQATMQEITTNRLLERFRRESSLTTYLGVIVRNVALRYSRSNRADARLSPAIPNPHSPFAAIEIAEALHHLSPDEVVVVQLDVAGYTSDEIADALSRIAGKPVTPAAVRKQLERARRKMREYWQEHEERGS